MCRNCVGLLTAWARNHCILITFLLSCNKEIVLHEQSSELSLDLMYLFIFISEHVVNHTFVNENRYILLLLLHRTWAFQSGN